MKLSLPLLLGLVYGVSELGLGVLKRSRDDSVDADASTLRVLWLTIVISLAAGMFASEHAIGASFSSLAVFWIGLALFVAGLMLRWYSIFHLGRYFTVNVAIHSGHEVVDTGPYKRIRHPSYAGALLAFLGLAVCLGNWLSLALIMVPITWAFARRMSIEEAALSNALGRPYINYMSRTKRLAPFIY
jgi:protein-S-isoprenylcysteine O-methyltransferase